MSSGSQGPSNPARSPTRLASLEVLSHPGIQDLTWSPTESELSDHLEHHQVFSDPGPQPSLQIAAVVSGAAADLPSPPLRTENLLLSRIRKPISLANTLNSTEFQGASPAMASDAYEAQKAQAIAQIANVSKLLRDAIAATLPVAPEQYLTVAVPGTTIDTRPIAQGGTFIWEATETAFPPTQVQQAEANLVDYMVPLSYVMVSPEQPLLVNLDTV